MAVMPANDRREEQKKQWMGHRRRCSLQPLCRQSSSFPRTFKPVFLIHPLHSSCRFRHHSPPPPLPPCLFLSCCLLSFSNTHIYKPTFTHISSPSFFLFPCTTFHSPFFHPVSPHNLLFSTPPSPLGAEATEECRGASDHSSVNHN